MVSKVAKVAVALLIVIGLFLGYVAMQPSDYVIAREMVINAPAERIFPYLNNPKLAESWGPWLEEDPKAKMSYSGPNEGVGARASWEGGEKLGTGSATITESVPNQRVVTRLEYRSPMSMSQESVYQIQPSGTQNVVTWKVQGKNSFEERLLCVFINMDKVVGGMFEKGLNKLKKLVEQQS